MTGEKDKFTTHEKLWKLDDTQLSTPKHDELVLQLLNPINALKISSNYKYGMDWKIASDNEQLAEDVKDAFSKHVESLSDRDSEWNCPDIKSEVPLKTGNNNFIIGYVDVQLTFQNVYEFKAIKYEDALDGILIFERKSRINYNPIDYLGKITVCNSDYCMSGGNTTVYNIEVKPEIDSFGKTLRQINTYREYFPNAVYCIYSPDTHFRKAFETQGVEFITPEDIGIKM
jgi:hypothetical protein